MSLESRIQRLEDIEEIKNLKHTYCYLVDKRDWDGVVELFSEDCRGDWGNGFLNGKEQIAKFFQNTVASNFQFFVHDVHNPIIQVNGNTASGRWYLTEAGVVSGTAIWAHGWYNQKYKRENGTWKISETIFQFDYYTPFDKGWAEERVWSGPQENR